MDGLVAGVDVPVHGLGIEFGNVFLAGLFSGLVAHLELPKSQCGMGAAWPATMDGGPGGLLPFGTGQEDIDREATYISTP